MNKLTPEKFDRLTSALLGVGLDSKHLLKGVIILIFEKAVDEHKFGALYAQLCVRIDEDGPNFEEPGSATSVSVF